MYFPEFSLGHSAEDTGEITVGFCCAERARAELAQEAGDGISKRLVTKVTWWKQVQSKVSTESAEA